MKIRVFALAWLTACGGKSSEQPCMDGFERTADGQCEAMEGAGSGDGGSSDGSADVGTDTGLPSGTDDGGTGADSGSGDDGGSGSGAPDGGGSDGGPIPVGVTLETGEITVCENPGDRAAQPFVPVDWGVGWSTQNHASSTRDPIAASGLTIEDFDGDGVYEIYIPQVAADQLYVRQADGSYADESSVRLPAGLDSASTAATALDVEPDGDLDLLVTRRVGGLTLLINDGSGYFTDGTASAGLDRTAHPAVSAAVADMDQDGDMDFFVITYRHCDTLMGEDPPNPYDDTTQSLWENQGDGTFVDVSDRMPEHPGINARLRAAAWFDADLDGDLDLYTVSDKSVFHACMVPNQLFLNQPSGFEEDAARFGLDIVMEGMGIALGDLDGDDYPDLAMSDMGDPSVMLYNEGAGLYIENGRSLGMFIEQDSMSQWSGWGTEFADFNNDGNLDMFMGFGGLADVFESTMNPWVQGDALWLRDAAGRFEQVSMDWEVDGAGSTRAVIATDLNDDGWIDLATREIAGMAHVWLAQCGANSWLKVDLHQVGGNPNAVGAVVHVTADGETTRHWMTRGAAGLQSSEPMTAHFGLGSATIVDLQITWPDGEISTFEALDVNQRVRVTRNP